MHHFAKLFAASVLSLGAVTALPSVASAVTASECRQMFASADQNGDGILSRSEIADSSDVPSELQDRGRVTMGEFVAECRDD